MTNATTHGASPLEQPPLPFARDALAPAISADTIGVHYDKHHKGYFDTLVKLVAGSPLAGQTLEQIIRATTDDPAQVKIFNNAAQAWNHNFYWASLSPKALTPGGALAAAIARDFGDLAAVQAALIKAGTEQFGSGWAWLVADGDTLKVVATHDAGVRFTSGQRPLLTVDVWEHAYYLDVQNRRADYLKAVVEGHLNWDFAAANFAAD
ncbi:MAG: superoxide dismutase [Fe] [Alphaproteobacteria bacterium PA4]|nr:MAG: superoxide dismutase [Fe] [Alphaproteobacteria bacterium PA4]